MLNSNVWSRLKASEKGQVATTLCLQWTTTVPMPPELLKLEALSSFKMLNIIRLGTYCAKVTTYNCGGSRRVSIVSMETPFGRLETRGQTLDNSLW